MPGHAGCRQRRVRAGLRELRHSLAPYTGVCKLVLKVQRARVGNLSLLPHLGGETGWPS